MNRRAFTVALAAGAVVAALRGPVLVSDGSGLGLAGRAKARVKAIYGRGLSMVFRDGDGQEIAIDGDGGGLFWTSTPGDCVAITLDTREAGRDETLVTLIRKSCDWRRP